MNSIGHDILRSSVVLIASMLCLQAAIADQGPTDDKSLKSIQPISVETNSEINSPQGHKLRLRLLTLDPGDIATLHSHNHRTVLQVIKGILTSHPQGMPQEVLRAGVIFVQDKDSNCWIQNTGSEPAQFIWQSVYDALP